MSQASELGWRALIDEDRLLSRVEILESQLQMYSKVNKNKIKNMCNILTNERFINLVSRVLISMHGMPGSIPEPSVITKTNF